MKAPPILVRNESVLRGIETQTQQLAEWRSKLVAACWCDLENECMRRNAALPPGASLYDVFRGLDLTSFIVNWKPV